jgi:hypothetical protein
MPAETTFLYLLLVSFISFALILIALLVFAWSALKKYSLLKSDYIKLSHSISKDAQKLYQEASVKSQLIVDEASSKASRILSQTEIFSQKQQGAVEGYLLKIQESFAEEYRRAMEAAQKDSQVRVEEISNDVDEALRRHLDFFGKQVEDNLRKIRDASDQSTGQMEQIIEKQAEEYKKLRFNQIDAVVFEVVKTVSKEVLSKEMKNEDNERIVMKALEDAKKQSLFG